MMPKTSVSPAASRNSSSPNGKKAGSRVCSATLRAALRPGHESFHRALVVEAILVVLDDGRDGLERELAVSVLDDVLQIEILDRHVVVAELEAAAQRLKVG